MVIRSLLALAAAGALLAAAGCGSTGPSKPFTAAGTAPCLTKAGFKDVTTNKVKVGFIAGFAEYGGVKADAPGGNVVTIAFTADATSAVDSAKSAFRRFAPPSLRPRMDDIMESQGNAVLVWTVSPTPKQLAAATGCLHA
ncbi:MAG: hypothetical protein QOI27_529 [Gaiellaceae bacterium]|jgi:hypothetical protein|nr:hypothetical protein [Gaiellaceae bacterium]MDX6470743.1 hypothetical protein [Gaiellaceae bacterium]